MITVSRAKRPVVGIYSIGGAALPPSVPKGSALPIRAFPVVRYAAAAEPRQTSPFEALLVVIDD